MNVALRALSWAVRFFWIIVLAFAVTGVYSAMQTHIYFGDWTIALEQEKVILTLPLVFDNEGYYNIADLNITATIADSEKNRISSSSSYLAKILPQENTTIFHNVSFSLNDMTTQENYLFNDSSFLLYGEIRLDFADLVPFRVETNETIPWGAPLYNFNTGTPRYTPSNATHMRVNVPINFQNHSPYFSVTGTLHVEIFNGRHQQLGANAIFIEVPPNEAYSGEVEMFVNMTMMTRTGQIRVSIETVMFDYGPMVMNYG